MDPLSVTATIIAVLQAANTVISECYRFRAAVRDYPRELNRVLEEVKGLRAVLESLEKLSANAEMEHDTAETARLPTLKLLCQADRGPLDESLKILNSLRLMLAPLSCSGQAASKRRAFIQTVSWRLKEADVTKSLADLERYKNTLSLAITADEA